MNSDLTVDDVSRKQLFCPSCGNDEFNGDVNEGGESLVECKKCLVITEAGKLDSKPSEPILMVPDGNPFDWTP